MDKCTSSQLIFLILLQQLGSSVVVNLGIQAKQDAWITILAALIGGLALLWLHVKLHQLYPGVPLTGVIRKILGKWLGWPLALLYVLYFIYVGSRVLRDLSYLLDTVLLDHTPLSAISAFLIICIIYVLSHGLENLAKTGEIFGMIYLLSIFFILAVFFITRLPDPARILPVAEDPLLILKTAYPLVYTFPYGEIILFTMLYPYVQANQSLYKITAITMIFSGLVLSFTLAVVVSVLGAEVTDRSTFPLLTALGKINLINFLQRLDILAIVILVIGGFFKIALFFMSAVIGATDLFKAEQKKVVMPIGTIIFVLAQFIAANIAEHLNEGLYFVPRYLHLPMQTGFPLLLFLIGWIKKKRAHSSDALHPPPNQAAQ
jgi:spore germination protein KB